MARYGLFVLKVPLNPNQPTTIIKDKQLDTITSLILFMLLHNGPRCLCEIFLRLISSK